MSAASDRLASALGLLSVTRLGAVTLAGFVAYIVSVVPEELAVLLGASLAGSLLIGLLPLAVVLVVVRAPI